MGCVCPWSQWPRRVASADLFAIEVATVFAIRVASLFHCQNLPKRKRMNAMQRVLINSDGDMIVRPSFIEAAVQKRSTSSVVQHLLINYQRAHVAIIKAQFTSKRLRDGMLVCVCPFVPCSTRISFVFESLLLRLLQQLLCCITVWGTPDPRTP